MELGPFSELEGWAGPTSMRHSNNIVRNLNTLSHMWHSLFYIFMLSSIFFLMCDNDLRQPFFVISTLDQTSLLCNSCLPWLYFGLSPMFSNPTWIHICIIYIDLHSALWSSTMINAYLKIHLFHFAWGTLHNYLDIILVYVDCNNSTISSTESSYRVWLHNKLEQLIYPCISIMKYILF